VPDDASYLDCRQKGTGASSFLDVWTELEPMVEEPVYLTCKICTTPWATALL